MRREPLLQHFELLTEYIRYKYQAWSIPTDLEHVAHSLGVSKIIYEKMNAWGCVEQSGKNLIIRIKEDAPKNRQRFSLAHEIGHVILERLKNKPNTNYYKKFRSQATVADSIDEEAMADMLAACLLIPTHFLTTALCGEIRMQNIKKAATITGTSLSAMLLRTMSVVTEPCAVFMARRIGLTDWDLKWCRGSQSISDWKLREELENNNVLEKLISGKDDAKYHSGIICWGKTQHDFRRFDAIQTVHCLVEIRNALR